MKNLNVWNMFVTKYYMSKFESLEYVLKNGTCKRRKLNLNLSRDI